PSSPGVVYDTFDHAIIAPEVAGSTATVAADLRHLPARLFAIAPAALGPPKLSAQPSGDSLSYAIQAVDEAGKPIAGRVPLRIRLFDGANVALEIVRGT